MSSKIRKSKPKPPAAPPAAPFYPLKPVCPELVAFENRGKDERPWAWMPMRTSMPRAIGVRFDAFRSASAQLVDGGTGKRLYTVTSVASVKNFGTVALMGAGVGGKAISLVTAVPCLDPVTACDCFAGTYGNPLSDDWFRPATHGRLLFRRMELVMLAAVAVAARSGEMDGIVSESLVTDYVNGWKWDEEVPVGPVGSAERLDDPRTWKV